jgi:5-methyltetrahydropteroyltriglutamate--homocysteine methyltransferase
MTVEPTELASLRVDQVGSLIRTEGLRETVARQRAGEASEEELRAAQDAAVREVIAQQEALGFPVVTDGEFRRFLFQETFGRSTSGWDGPPTLSVRTPVAAPLRLTHNRLLDEFVFARDVATRPVKVTVISVDRITQRFDTEASRAVYPDLDSFVRDVAGIERQMVDELVAAGCRYLQTDAPSYTAYVDTASLDQMRARGEDPEANLERSIQADNAVIADFPGVTFGVHLCRGNMATPHRYGHYDAIAERLFHGLQHQRFLLEYDTERAGTFEPLRFMPKGKVAVLGLVSTKEPDLEPADALARRIDEASKYLPLEQLAISPQCGFSSGVGGGPPRLSRDEQFRKLERVLEVARQVWG